MKNHLKYLKIVILQLLCVGCTVGPKYEPPTMDIPESWQSTPSEEMNTLPTDHFIWWQSLNDPILNSLIQRAAQQNLDLFIAGTRLLEARAARKGKTGDLYPHIDASVTTGHLNFSKKGIIKDLLDCSHEESSRHRNSNFFEFGFDAGWEIDLFGLTKHEIQAMQAKLEGVENHVDNVWISLSAEVARNYVELRSLQQRQKILSRHIESQKDTIHLTRELRTIGLDNDITLIQTEEQLHLLTAQKPLIALAIDKSIYRLSILLGCAPGVLYQELIESGDLPLLPCEKPIGLPSELLRRRPDIRQSERELAAATEMVGAAVASLFPRFSLYGFVGEITTQLKNLTNGTGAIWFVAPQLLMPIFNSRLITQNIDLNKIKTQQALFEYQKTVLNALEEVEGAIASYRYEMERHHSLSKALKANQEAYQLTLDLYQKGLNDYLVVLSTNRSLLAAEDAYLQNQRDLLFHYISLYKALGGGWKLTDCACEEEHDVIEK